MQGWKVDGERRGDLVKGRVDDGEVRWCLPLQEK